MLAPGCGCKWPERSIAIGKASTLACMRYEDSRVRLLWGEREAGEVPKTMEKPSKGTGAAALLRKRVLYARAGLRAVMPEVPEAEADARRCTADEMSRLVGG